MPVGAAEAAMAIADVDVLSVEDNVPLNHCPDRIFNLSASSFSMDQREGELNVGFASGNGQRMRNLTKWGW